MLQRVLNRYKGRNIPTIKNTRSLVVKEGNAIPDHDQLGVSKAVSDVASSWASVHGGRPVATLDCTSLVCFNLLAPCYKRLDGYGMRESSLPIWKDRCKKIIEQVLLGNDIICLQEYWFDKKHDTIYQPLELKYHSLKFGRPNKPDGLALFIRSNHTIIEQISYDFEDVGYRVGLAAHIKLENGKEVVVANVHLTFPHNHFDENILRVQQITQYYDYIKEYIQNTGKNIPVIFAGDFNSSNAPRDNVVQYLLKNGFESAIQHGTFISHLTHRNEHVGADYFFYTEGIKVLKKTIGVDDDIPKDIWPDNFHLSDHKPLFVDFEITDEDQKIEDIL
eukprot:TRINITY_DN10947_c0_g1_i1.p1 TRINITY_DN10947_c0_g1~~TRINITY_DN10947_c0_g1_i1.p1  ORF type:complete len:334 (-),score=65.79 TRINITY_DN10947_c0_g1_i1:13-1014(-)